MASILKNAKTYKRIPYKILGQERHINDPYTVPPQILKVDSKNLQKEKSPDDISTFPK